MYTCSNPCANHNANYTFNVSLPSANNTTYYTCIKKYFKRLILLASFKMTMWIVVQNIVKKKYVDVTYRQSANKLSHFIRVFFSLLEKLPYGPFPFDPNHTFAF